MASEPREKPPDREIDGWFIIQQPLPFREEAPTVRRREARQADVESLTPRTSTQAPRRQRHCHAAPRLLQSRP